MIFDQGMDGTTLRVTWTGVPIGEEDVTKRNFREYYVNNIKYVPLPCFMLFWTVTPTESFRSHFLVRRDVFWSVGKVWVAVAIGAVLIAVVSRLTFGYGLVL